jgi:hypothetical protein
MLRQPTRRDPHLSGDPHHPPRPSMSGAERRAVTRSYWLAYLWRKALLSAAVVAGALWGTSGELGGSFTPLFGLIFVVFALLNLFTLAARVTAGRASLSPSPDEHHKVTAARVSLRRSLGVFGVVFGVSAWLLGGLVAELSEEVGRSAGARDLTFQSGVQRYLVDALDVRQDLMFDSRQELVTAGRFGGARVEVTLTAAVSVEGARADGRRFFLVDRERKRLSRDTLLSADERLSVVERLVERARKALALRPTLKEQCVSVADPALDAEHHALLKLFNAAPEGAPVTFLRRELSQRCMKHAFGSLFIFFALSLSLEVALLLGLMKQRLAVDAARRLHPSARA